MLVELDVVLSFVSINLDLKIGESPIALKVTYILFEKLKTFLQTFFEICKCDCIVNVQCNHTVTTNKKGSIIGI